MLKSRRIPARWSNHRGRHLRRLGVLAAALVSIALGAVRSPSAAYTIERSHPRLYFAVADLDTLRARLSTTHAVQWQALQSWPQPEAGAFATYSGRDAGRTHRYIERNAFMYLMLASADPVQAEAHAQIALSWLIELAAYDFTTAPNDAFEFLWALAIGYDWLFTWPGFSEADKQAVRDQLVERTALHVNATGLNGFPAFPTGPATSKSIYDNMSTENNMASALAGLALWEPGDPYGTNGAALNFLDAAYHRFREMYAATRAHASDGGWWEGQGYYGARLQGEVYFALTWLVATGEDLLADNDHLRNAVYYWIYGLRPDGRASREGDQTCLAQGACDRNRHIASVLASYYQNGHFQWYAQYQGVLAGAGWEEIALYDASVGALDPATLPLYRHFQFGRLVIRTGWDIAPGSDDTYFTFDIHDWVSGHTHVDAASFTLFRRGPLAIDSGRYRGASAVDHAHERNYALRTVAHNTITVYRAGEDFGGLANDGGQEFLFKESNAAEPRFVADLAAGTRFDTGTLEAFEAGPGHYYLKGNATDAYHSTGYQAPSDGPQAKISHFTREIAFFPDEPDPLVVVFDRITSLQAGGPKRWLLHSIDAPQVSGSVSSEEVPEHIVTYNGDLVTISRDGGRLFSRTLLPASAGIRKVGGTGYEFWVGDPGANYPLSAPDVEAGAWRVEVRPIMSSTADTFLHALSVTSEAVTTMPPSRLIDAGPAYGAEVGDRVVLFAKTSTPVQDIDYTVETSGVPVHHLLTGMSPGQYDVTRDGTDVAGSPFVTTSDRTVAFETPGAGSVSVRWRSGVADLVVTSSGNPPPALNPGGSFSISGTVANVGSAPAGDSTTRYYLSVDTLLDAGDMLLTGEQAVPGLGPGGTSTGSATLTIAGTTPHGIYFLLACADADAVVAENNEIDNCRAAGATIRVGVADLAVTAIGDPPASIRAGLGFPATATVVNFGTAAAPDSTLRYYLSLDAERDGSDMLLSGSRSVPSLIPGAQATGTTNVTVSVGASPGTYYLIACADTGAVVLEGDELNNCLASASTVEVRVPDLVVTAVSATPAGVAPGGALTVSDTTLNQGVVDAPASKTRYYLSADSAISDDDKLLSGSRSVPALAAGAASTGAATVSVPATTALGTYRVLACADGLHAVGEVDESNNCMASVSVVVVGRPDLLVTAVTASPGPVLPGGALVVTETVQNQGPVSAGASRIRYYLSSDEVKSTSDKLLTGTRQVPGLAPGALSTGTASVIVPSSTPAGIFYLLACADDLKAVTEAGEANNCRATDSPLVVGAPDLLVSVVSNPPGTANPGGTFSLTDTTRNQGVAATGPSTRTRYYLSINTAKEAGDKLLTGSRLVPNLAPGAQSTGTVTVTVPPSTASGNYHLLACADDTTLVAETSETNNCEASATRVLVSP